MDRVNRSDGFMWRNFYMINAMHRADVSQRDQYPLGDEGHDVELIRAQTDPGPVAGHFRTPLRACRGAAWNFRLGCEAADDADSPGVSRRPNRYRATVQLEVRPEPSFRRNRVARRGRRDLCLARETGDCAASWSLGVRTSRTACPSILQTQDGWASLVPPRRSRIIAAAATPPRRVCPAAGVAGAGSSG